MFWQKNKTSDNPLPVYMDPIEFSQLTAIVESIGPRTFLEWGSGGSTRALLKECPFIERYVSVEHDVTWGQRVKEIVDDPRLDLHLIQPDQPLEIPKPTRDQEIAWNARAEREPSLMKSYVEFPRTLDVTFDMILVDGRARRLCLLEGINLLKDGGVIVLHDAQREDYHDALHQIGTVRFLEPWKAGQIALVRKEARHS